MQQTCLNSHGSSGSTDTITLYHGSAHAFDMIDVARGKPFKDFGIGFYTSRDREHAVRLALRNRDIEARRMARIGKGGTVTSWLYTFTFDLRNLRDLNVKTFQTADREWVEFIVKNRQSAVRVHDFDIVSGPTANDNTNATVDLFMLGTYGDPKSDSAVDMFLRLIRPDILPSQMFFGSQRAADLLKCVDRRPVC
jgi:hypothetical protein